MEKPPEMVAGSFSDPVHVFGHFTYALLIVSMLIRNIAWLQGLAAASGLAKIVYRRSWCSIRSACCGRPGLSWSTWPSLPSCGGRTASGRG